jgi:uncharacterized protein
MHTAKNDIINVHSHFQGKFNTSTGRLIDLKDPTPEMIHIEDIATALSRICRFGGHSSAFYNVAQHSLLVTYKVPHEAKKWALMHDAAEAYLGDVIKPLKVLLEPHYRLIEERFEQAIIKAFDIPVTDEIKEHVKKADQEMLEVEHEALILGKPGRMLSIITDTVFDEDDRWAWNTEFSKDCFISSFQKLFK